MGDYWDIPLHRQREIAKIAHRKRRYLSAWQRKQIRIWRIALSMNKELPEQQRFFMRGVENALIDRGLMKQYRPNHDTSSK